LQIRLGSQETDSTEPQPTSSQCPDETSSKILCPTCACPGFFRETCLLSRFVFPKLSLSFIVVEEEVFDPQDIGVLGAWGFVFFAAD
jgi:hypothetical protein